MSQKSKICDGTYGKFNNYLNCRNSNCTQDSRNFGSTVCFLRTANLKVSFKFIHGYPCCHGNEI